VSWYSLLEECPRLKCKHQRGVPGKEELTGEVLFFVAPLASAVHFVGIVGAVLDAVADKLAENAFVISRTLKRCVFVARDVDLQPTISNFLHRWPSGKLS